MRVCLFTDTLGDVNGVCRFIRTMAEQAAKAGKDLRIAASTRMPVPPSPSTFIFDPLAAARLPGYPDLQIALPPARAMRRWAAEQRPDVIHISTPGPVGLVGRAIARRMGVPLVGVYHTDFPAYVGHLIKVPGSAAAARAVMRWFYRPFARVLTRSAAYVPVVEALGIERGRIAALRPGVDTETFHPRHRDAGLWRRYGAEGTVVLYVGRVSVEKGVPLLARAWKRVKGAEGGATLAVVGDGPYRAAMERELRGSRAVFLGFRHGEELSRLYASADVFVFPSRTDTLGQVVMEAMASGLPALVTDEGGPRETVGDAGVVVRGGEQEWARAMAGMLEDEGRRRALGERARARMEGMSAAVCFAEWWGAMEGQGPTRQTHHARQS